MELFRRYRGIISVVYHMNIDKIQTFIEKTHLQCIVLGHLCINNYRYIFH